MLFLDLDHFKSVNDTLGHHVGDQLLQDVANRLTRSVRADDIVSRVGGDEFAVLLPGLVDQWTAAEVADRVSDALAAPFSPHGEAAVRIDLGGSIGIAFFPAHGEDVDTIFQHADAAMYTAKSRGLDSVVYSDHSTEGIGGAILTELREALQSGPETAGLAVHYQPQVELGSGEVVGVEALVRWRHQRLGWIAPTEFVPMAERGVLIGELTRWMLDTSLAQLRDWEDAGLKLRVAVNISVRDLQSVELADFLARRLVHYQLPADRLRVEIDDASSISGRENVQAALDALEDLGVGISLDHFGIGYCSLTRLRRLPVSEVKIDSSFVSRLMSDDDDAAVVRSIVDLASALELAVVAEGVEDEPTWRALAALGCNGAQGNYFAHPMPPPRTSCCCCATAAASRSCALSRPNPCGALRTSAEVGGEKGEHPAPGVLVGVVVVAQAGDPHQRSERADGEAVGEPVAGARVLLDVVYDLAFGQQLVELGGRPTQPEVASAEARHDRAGVVEGAFVPRHRSVVGRARVEPAGRGDQREAAAHAEAGDTDLAVGVRMREQLLPGGLDVVEGLALRGKQLAEDRLDAADEAAAMEQVRHQREVAGGAEPVGDLPYVVGHPEGVMHDHHGRPRPVAGHLRLRHGQVAVDGSGRGGDSHVHAAEPTPSFLAREGSHAVVRTMGIRIEEGKRCDGPTCVA